VSRFVAVVKPERASTVSKRDQAIVIGLLIVTNLVLALAIVFSIAIAAISWSMSPLASASQDLPAAESPERPGAAVSIPMMTSGGGR
jgi:hypothetical protein